MTFSRILGLSACMLLASGPCHASVLTDNLPEIGTTAASTLSIGQELQMGDFYVRDLRGNAPLITDPLLNRYINQLGQRLVSHAFSVRTPFHFYLMQNEELNAFAFFGGNVVLHSSLFAYTDNESQLASVMAHEISHVTQRHLARAMEDQKRNAPLTWVGALGSILLAMASPQAGMAGLAGTLASNQQSMITFTQQNEQEADRIGLQVLQRSGFDPQAMPAFLQKLADQTRYSSLPPEILLTHPLPDSRLSDTRNRANQMPPHPVSSSLDFYLAKVRVFSLDSPQQQKQQLHPLLIEYAAGNLRQQFAANYGRALVALNNKQYQEAERIIKPLLTQNPNNPWLLDIMTDIDISLKKSTQAVSRLQGVADKKTDPVIAINLANALLKAGQIQQAINQLNYYTWMWPEDTNGWDLLIEANGMAGKKAEQRFAQAQLLALTGKLGKAIQALSDASNLAPAGSMAQQRYDARIDQLHQLQQRFLPYQRG